MMKFVIVFACLVAMAYGGGLTGLAGQSILAAPIGIQKVITAAPIIKTPLLIPQIAIAPQPILKASPIVAIGKGGLGLGGLGGLGGGWGGLGW